MSMQRVQIKKDIDLSPYTVLKAGEKGTVVAGEYVSGEAYSLDIRMDKEHEGLALWANHAHLAGPELEALAPVRIEFPRVNLTRLGIVAMLLLLAWFLYAPLNAADAMIEVNEVIGRDARPWTEFEQMRANQWLPLRSYPRRTSALRQGSSAQ